MEDFKWCGRLKPACFRIDFFKKPLNGSYADIGLQETGFDIFDSGWIELSPDQATQGTLYGLACFG